MEVRINLNEIVKFKLSERGKEIYRHRYDGYGFEYNREPELDDDGYMRMQLWTFMQIYGEHMILGMHEVIKPLEIIYEEEAAKKPDEKLQSSAEPSGRIRNLPPVTPTVKAEHDGKSICHTCATNNCPFQSGIYRKNCDFYTSEDDADIIRSIEEAKAKGISLREWIRELYDRK